MNCGWVFQLFSAKCCFYQQILPFCSLQEINIAFWITQRTDCLPQRLPYFSLGKGNGHNSCICASNTALLFTLFIPSGYPLRDALSCFPLILTRTLWDRMETVVFYHSIMLRLGEMRGFCYWGQCVPWLQISVDSAVCSDSMNGPSVNGKVIFIAFHSYLTHKVD